MDQAVCFLEDCPGKYCGRELTDSVNGSCYSDCEACPIGYRVDPGSSLCLKCDSDADLRDYLFLGFVCLFAVTVRLAVIGTTTVGQPISLAKLAVFGLSVLENILAVLWTLLVLDPAGSLKFYSCEVHEVSDFYPIFYNPTEDYVHQIHCTYEVAYPLYRMVFIFLGFSFLHHLLLLPCHCLLIKKFEQSLQSTTEFYWLIAFPVVVVFFAVFGGLLYFSFDYLLIVVTVGSYAIISAVTQLTKFGFRNPFKLYRSVEHWCFAGFCVVCLIYGILSLTDAGSVSLRAKVLPVVFAPMLLHPLLSLLASPQAYLSAWTLRSYGHFYDY